MYGLGDLMDEICKIDVVCICFIISYFCDFDDCLIEVFVKGGNFVDYIYLFV